MRVGDPDGEQSSTSTRPRFFCFSVEGWVGDCGSDCVSITT
jgi:hypothetical protein